MDFNAGRFEGQTSIADISRGIRSLASQLACRTHIDATAAKPADFRPDIERRHDFFLKTTFNETDST